MPTKTWDLESDWDGAYRLFLRTGGVGSALVQPKTVRHYQRGVMFDLLKNEWDKLLALFTPAATDAICIVGCGFAWAIEYLRTPPASGGPAGGPYLDTHGADTSDYIDAAKATVDPDDGEPFSKVPGRIHKRNMVTPGDVNRFLRDTAHRNGPGGEAPYDWVFLERVASSLDDTEVPFLDGQIRTLDVVKYDGNGWAADPGTVVWIESQLEDSGQDPAMTWRALADLQLLVPDSVVVRSGGHAI